MDYKNNAGQNLNMSVILNFDENEKCTVAPMTAEYQLNDSVRVYNIAATGNGAFVKRGEKNSWGNKDRDALYVQYNVSYEIETQYPNTLPAVPPTYEQASYITTDTLVVRDRGVKLEQFEPVLNN